MLSVNWQSCIDKLKDELPLQQFNTWIRPLKVEADQQSVTLVAPNRFVRDWVEEKYRERIEQLLKNVNGVEQVLFTISERKPDLTELSSTIPQNTPASAELLTAGQGHNKTLLEAEAKNPVDRIGIREPVDSEIDQIDQTEQDNQTSENTSPPIIQSVIAGKLNHKSRLNGESTFDNFIVGKSNQLARAAAIQVAENPGKAYNPLFIYGGVGLGKTHLMHAIGNFMLKRKPNAKIVYLHSETFVATMVTALQLNAINEFKRFYRSVDALLIDDIQFFAGKERSQEEFFHTFNALLEGGQQIILTLRTGFIKKSMDWRKD